MTAITHQPATPSIGPERSIGLTRSLVRLAHTLSVWCERARERRALAAMDVRGLKDIGISNVDAWREANKPVWRP